MLGEDQIYSKSWDIYKKNLRNVYEELKHLFF